MKREIVASLAITSAALLGGCAVHENFSGPTPAHVAHAGHKPDSDNENAHPVPALIKVDAGTLPDKLPLAVKENVAASVTVDDVKRYPDPYVFNTLYYGSGVRVGRNEFLTAGHMVKNGDDKPLKNMIAACGGLSIDAPTKDWTAETKSGKKLTGEELESMKWVGSYLSGDNSKTPDIALVQSKNLYGSLGPYRAIKIARTAPKIGEKLFFVNYEPTATGEIRDPYQISFGGESLQRVKRFSQPAIYGGIVGNIARNGDATVMTDLRSYGATHDAVVRGGASGGPVYNAKGQLVGITIEGPADNTTESLTTMDESFDLDLTGVRPNQRLSFAIIQPVTSTLLTHLNHELASTTCTETAPGMNG